MAGLGRSEGQLLGERLFGNLGGGSAWPLGGGEHGEEAGEVLEVTESDLSLRGTSSHPSTQ